LAKDTIQFEPQLTPLQQEIGRKRYLSFAKINSLSYGCLADTMLILFAIKNGADDFLIGMLTSFYYLTMPLMFIGKEMVGKIGAAHTYSRCWTYRNLFAAGMIFVPFVIQFVNPTAGLILLVISALGFFGFRSMGVTAHTPILGEITTKENLGSTISQNWFMSHTYLLITMILSIVILRLSDSMLVFQGIITFGVVTGILSARIISQVPESQKMMISGKQPVKNSFAFTWKTQRVRKLLFAWSTSATMSMLVIPFATVALKNGYQVSDYNALIFTVVYLVGAIVAAFINRIILDRVGPRPMLILYTIGMLIISLLWVLTPKMLIFYYTAIIFFLIGICRIGTETTLSHYFLTVVPDKERVGSNMWIFLISGTLAGLAGTLMGGGLLKLLRAFGFVELYLYRTYFLIILVIFIPLLWIVKSLEPIADWKIKDVLGVFLSFRDMRTLFTLLKLEQNLNLDEELTGVLKLEELPSELSEKKLLSYLDSPRFIIRGKALRALQQIRFGAKTEKALIKELERGEYTTGYIVAEILGEHKIRDSIPALRHSLKSGDFFLQGKTMLALAQLKDEASYDEISNIFTKSNNPRIVIHGARAIVEIGAIDGLSPLLQKMLDLNLPQQVQEELLYSTCELSGCGDEFYQFHKSFKKDRYLGVLTLQEIINNRLIGSKKLLTEFDEHLSLFKDNSSFESNEALKFLCKKIGRRSSSKMNILKFFIQDLDSNVISQELYLSLLLICTTEIAKD
jgi:hypothetical protein